MKPAPGTRHISLVVPILLVVLGFLFLYSNWQPGFDPWPVLWNYWPALLVLVGLGMVWDTVRRRNSPGNSLFPLGSTIGTILFVLLLIALFRHSPQFVSARGASFSLSHTHETLDRRDAKSLHATLRLGSGQIMLRGGSSQLFEGDFQFRPASSKPIIDYHLSGDVGELDVTQNQKQPSFGNSRNEWNLRFPDDLPLELSIELGAGQQDLQFKNMDLRKLNVKVGAGQLDVDLTGDRKQDLDAEIQGGFGQASVRLPKNVGVTVHASGGIGSIDTAGLKKEDGDYVNEAFGKSAATIHLTVQGGIGAIHLIETN